MLLFPIIKEHRIVLIYTFFFVFSKQGMVLGFLTFLTSFLFSFLLNRLFPKSSYSSGLIVFLLISYIYWYINLPFIKTYSFINQTVPSYFPTFLFPPSLFPRSSTGEFFAIVLLSTLFPCVFGIAVDKLFFPQKPAILFRFPRSGRPGSEGPGLH